MKTQNYNYYISQREREREKQALCDLFLVDSFKAFALDTLAVGTKGKR